MQTRAEAAPQDVRTPMDLTVLLDQGSRGAASQRRTRQGRMWISALMTILACLASTSPAAAGSTDQVHAALLEQLPGLQKDQIRASEVPGLFEVRLDGGSAFVTGDGKYLIRGDLFEVATRKNLSDVRRGEERRAMLNKLDPSQLITFSAATPKHTITVFTDVDCGYCRKLHSQIAEYNALGISVRYAAFPRSGPNTPTWETMEAVWCSQDRNEALTRAKLGEAVVGPQGCATTIVHSDYRLGEQMGVQGTPMIVLEDGGAIGGYMPPEQLIQALEQRFSPQAAAANR